MPRLPARSIVLLLLVATASVIVPRADAQQRLRKLVEQRRNSHQATDLPAGTRVRRDIAYGPDPAQRYDVYLPANAKADAPILFMVHGGGWRRGDKAYSNVVGNKAAHWLAKGHVFVSANNRLVPAADPLTQARDIAAAVASVQKHAPQWGADPKRTILMGHSAGAHLVALLGASPTLLAQAGAMRPLGVVALDSGALDVPALIRPTGVRFRRSSNWGARHCRCCWSARARAASRPRPAMRQANWRVAQASCRYRCRCCRKRSNTARSTPGSACHRHIPVRFRPGSITCWTDRSDLLGPGRLKSYNSGTL